VQRIIGRIQIQHDLSRRLAVRLHKLLHPQPLDRRALRQNLVIAADAARGVQLQAVERALARQCCTARPAPTELANQHPKDRVVPQRLVIVEILVPERDPEHPLRHQRAHRVLDRPRITVIHKALGQAVNQPDRFIRALQQQRPGIRAHPSAIECRHHPPPLDT
jgi:hypothetical protein